MDKKLIGQKISSLRKEKGMTQKELAEKLCVTDKLVSKWVAMIVAMHHAANGIYILLYLRKL